MTTHSAKNIFCAHLMHQNIIDTYLFQHRYRSS